MRLARRELVAGLVESGDEKERTRHKRGRRKRPRLGIPDAWPVEGDKVTAYVKRNLMFYIKFMSGRW